MIWELCPGLKLQWIPWKCFPNCFFPIVFTYFLTPYFFLSFPYQQTSSPHTYTRWAPESIENDTEHDSALHHRVWHFYSRGTFLDRFSFPVEKCPCWSTWVKSSANTARKDEQRQSRMEGAGSSLIRQGCCCKSRERCWRPLRWWWVGWWRRRDGSLGGSKKFLGRMLIVC